MWVSSDSDDSGTEVGEGQVVGVRSEHWAPYFKLIITLTPSQPTKFHCHTSHNQTCLFFFKNVNFHGLAIVREWWRIVLSLVTIANKEQEDLPEIDDDDEDGGTVEIIQHHVAQWLS